MLGSLLFCVSFLVGLAAATPPNVVLIVGDDMGWGDFSFMGSPDVRTPHLDRLAANGAVFPNGYVPSSLCRASLATILTGLYGHQHKICCNDPPNGTDRDKMHPLIRSAPALPRLLAQAGWPSFQTGKYWEGHFSNAGFTDGMSQGGRHGDAGLAIGRKTMQPIQDFLGRPRSSPFFLWYAPMLPHQPHQPPPRLLDKYIIEGRDIHLSRYYAMCEWFDETVGELVQLLEERDLLSSTLILFVVDNGWIQATGATPETPLAYAPKSKRSPYDGGLRTPMILHWPGTIRPARYDDLVSTIDLAPTILSAAGLPIPNTMTGVDLLNKVRDGQPIDRDAVFGEIFLHTCVDIDRPGVNLTHRWIRAGQWKLIDPVEASTPSELYNIVQDPHEVHNQSTQQTAVREGLQARLDQWWSDTRGETTLSR